MSRQAIVEVMARVDGLFVGQLDAEEREALKAACEAGIASWSYEGAAGFLGLAKVRVNAAMLAASQGEKP